MEELDSYSDSVRNNSKIFVMYKRLGHKQSKGSQGIISNRTKLLGDIISKELKALESFVKEHNPTYSIDLYFCPKIWVEKRNRSFQETVPHRFAV